MNSHNSIPSTCWKGICVFFLLAGSYKMCKCRHQQLMNHWSLKEKSKKHNCGWENHNLNALVSNKSQHLCAFVEREKNDFGSLRQEEDTNGPRLSKKFVTIADGQTDSIQWYRCYITFKKWLTLEIFPSTLALLPFSNLVNQSLLIHPYHLLPTDHLSSWSSCSLTG